VGGGEKEGKPPPPDPEGILRSKDQPGGSPATELVLEDGAFGTNMRRSACTVAGATANPGAGGTGKAGGPKGTLLNGVAVADHAEVSANLGTGVA
jgi:hypothetical protein